MTAPYRNSHPLRIAILSQSGADEVGLGLCEAFRLNGCAAEMLAANDRWPDDIALHVIYGPMAPIGLLLRRLSQLPSRPSVAVWYTEPLPPPQPIWALTAAVTVRGAVEGLMRQSSGPPGERWKGRLVGLAGRLRACAEMRALHRWRMLDLLAVFTQRHAQIFGAWGLPVEQIPMGACCSFGHLMDLSRDIDVAFIGSTRDRRRGPIVAHLAQGLAAAGIRTVIKDGSPEHGYAFGADRAELLNRTKILLSVMRQPWDDPIFRLLLAAPNGAMVLSEPVRESKPFIPGQHFAVAELSEMPAAALRYLRADEERCRIAQAAHELVTGELTMASMARQFLEAWERRTAVQAHTASA